jgi:MscS family membrane protein
MLVVPNKKMVDSIVENITKEPARQMKMTLGLEYGTSLVKLDAAKAIVRKSIAAVKGVDKKQAPVVAFSMFADSSLNLAVIYWIKDLNRYWDVQDEINTAIKRDFEKAGIAFAFPTQTLHVRK